MFNLDPGKLLVIAVVAIILLGPDRLPQVARQVGGAWRSFNEFRHRMESEVRSTMPDLPPTSEIARLARSPSALLNHLSSMSSDDEDEVPDGSFKPPTSTNGATGPDTNGATPPAPDTNGATAPGADAGSNGMVGGGGTREESREQATTTSNGARRPDAAADAEVDPPLPAPTWSPPGAAAPEVIVPGDPTLN
jgi:sec-independent protein translocase protein TatB